MACFSPGRGGKTELYVETQQGRIYCHNKHDNRIFPLLNPQRGRRIVASSARARCDYDGGLQLV